MAELMVGMVDVKYKIDEKDRKIMKSLFEDGRMSIADIAKKTGLRRDTVARRLKNLVKQKVIAQFIPIINLPSLGYPNVATLILRVKSTTDTDKKRFQKMLVGNKFTCYVSRWVGKFDFYCAIVYKDTNHLNNIVEEIKNYIPNFIETFELFQVVEEPKFEDMDALL